MHNCGDVSLPVRTVNAPGVVLPTYPWLSPQSGSWPGAAEIQGERRPLASPKVQGHCSRKTGGYGLGTPGLSFWGRSSVSRKWGWGGGMRMIEATFERHQP